MSIDGPSMILLKSMLAWNHGGVRYPPSGGQVHHAPGRGAFARVISGGAIRIEDPIKVQR